MSKKIIISCLAIIFLLPIMFLGPHEELSVGQYLMSCVMPLMIVVLFLTNYYWFVPKNMEREDRTRLIIVNATIIVCIAILLVFWHKLEFNTFLHEQTHQIIQHGNHQHMTDHKPPRKHDSDIFYVFAALRDSINLVFAVFVAYTIRMNDHIADLRRQQQEAEVARREAELRGLRNQISPHFLLNTLNNIYALAAISVERTQGAVLQLSRMLRHMLYDNQAEMVTLRSEADFIQSYIDLMKLRLASNVKVETQIDIPEDSTTMVAPLLFISLVENAFKHGVSSTEPCFISITLREEQTSPLTGGLGGIICDISNSNHPKMSSDRSGHGVGLINVQQRLDITYPDRYEWVKGVIPPKPPVRGGVVGTEIYQSVLKIKIK